MLLLCDPWPWWLYRVDPSSCVCSVGGLSGLPSFFIFYYFWFPYYTSRFFFLILRETCFSFWYRTWRSNRDVCLICFRFLCFLLLYFLSMNYSLSFSVYIWKDDLFLTKPLYLWFLLLDFFFWDQNMLFENQQAATWTLHSWFIYNLLRSLLAFLIFQSASVLYMAWMQITSPPRW